MRHGVKVVSDEIHADFVFPGYRHTVFAGIKPEYAEMTITCTSPSKTFNLAGLQVSNIFIGNRELRNTFRKELYSTGYVYLNTMGLIACQAAYEKGEPWLRELRKYLEGNLMFIRSFLKQELPQIILVEPEGTYLTWLDFRNLGMPGEELDRFVLEDAGLWLDGGSMFGPEGEGFQRINIACPRITLERAFIRLKHAVNRL
jgi:cystathionine beta-lyase